IVGAAVSAAFAAPAVAECWGITNMRGYAAYADKKYSFDQDGIREPLMLCFTPKGGTVTGNDVRLFKFGDSTLAGSAVNETGMETFVVYQIDRVNKRALFT